MIVPIVAWLLKGLVVVGKELLLVLFLRKFSQRHLN